MMQFKAFMILVGSLSISSSSSIYSSTSVNSSPVFSFFPLTSRSFVAASKALLRKPMIGRPTYSSTSSISRLVMVLRSMGTAVSYLQQRVNDSRDSFVVFFGSLWRSLRNGFINMLSSWDASFRQGVVARNRSTEVSDRAVWRTSPAEHNEGFRWWPLRPDRCPVFL